MANILIISIDGLKLSTALASGSAISLISLTGSPPAAIAHSTGVANNIPVYLTMSTGGVLTLANYSGSSVLAGATIQGQLTYVCKLVNDHLVM